MLLYNNNSKSDILRRNFIQAIVGGDCDLTLREIQGRAESLGVSIFKPPFVVAAIEIDYSGCAIEQKDELIFSIEGYICRSLDRFGYDGAVVTDSFSRVIALLSLENKSTNATELDEVFATVHHNIWSGYSFGAFVGIGGIVDKSDKIAVSASDAREMLAYKYQYASKGVINIANISRFAHARFIDNQVYIDRVIGCFRGGDLGKLAIRLDELIAQVRYRPGVSKSSIRRTMIDLMIQVLNIASNADVEVDDVLDGRDPYRWILEQEHTEVQREWFLEVCSKLLVKMQENKQGEANQLLQQACKYVEDNLHRNDLSLLQVSSYVGLSGAYFSQMFKQEMGEGLSAYITRNRIERGKTMLRTTDLKVEDVALQNGFSSANYFSTVFKNIVGQTPAEYRRNCYMSEKIEKI